MTRGGGLSVPSTKFPGSKHVIYSEGQINGYRWYDKHAVVPAFPFGHELSYGGNASFSNLAVAERTVSFEVGVPQRELRNSAGVLRATRARRRVPPADQGAARGYEKICGGEGEDGEAGAVRPRRFHVGCGGKGLESGEGRLQGARGEQQPGHPWKAP